MSVLAGRRIVVGVTGGIAAYKAVEVCRRLVDAGAHVAPIMTAGAHHFVGETTLSALCSEKVQRSLWDEESPIPHTKLGQGADLVLVVPATARLVGAYAAGISSDLLTATLLATRAPVAICPAMHTEMWEHPAVQENLATLRRRGVHVIDPDVGRLAGGDSGAGRLAAPERIVATVERILGPNDFAGVNVLVTAGGTREAIDSVRVVTNRSSGKQGYAIAAEAAARGARVTLVTTVELPVPQGVAEVVKVTSAASMEAVVVPRAPEQDVIVMAAAVADFRPKTVVDRKIKKEDGLSEIVLEPTHDFLVDLGRAKPAHQVLVGFAAETDDVLDNAAGKLDRKNLDLIVANDVGAPNVGFEHDTNEVTILRRPSRAEATKVNDRPGVIRQNVALTDKRAIAAAVLDAIAVVRSGQPASPDSSPS